jgi:hypothetical protein
MSEQFKFSVVSYKAVRSREIGSSAPPQRLGLSSALVDCPCDHSWIAMPNVVSTAFWETFWLLALPAIYPKAYLKASRRTGKDS